MLKLLKSLLSPSAAPGAADADQLASALPPSPPPAEVSAPGVAPFVLGPALVDASGLPVLDWVAVQAWVDTLPDEPAQAAAWAACERAWLQHLGQALGPGYRLRAEGSVLLLSSLPDHVAHATLGFVGRTVQRIVRLLDGVAVQQPWGHDILIVFDDEDTYYRYVAHYFPEGGEFAASSGVYLNHGCGHFATVKADLRAAEPVIAHELTHSCLGHLPIPAWLNEGLAVNTEHRLCPPMVAANPLQQHARHQRFWQPGLMQEFWTGRSFLRTDEGSELSYDLARILVAQFAADWERFRPFALSAHRVDAGAAAAQQHLQIDLGAAVCALLEQEPDPAWGPQPLMWQDEPERGAFMLCPGE